MNNGLSRSDVDVLVCGGGVAGVVAATAAGLCGARTVLVERNGFLGGNATAGAVGQFNSWQTASGRLIIGGLAKEVVSRLRAIGGAGEHMTWTMSTGHLMDRVEYSPELLKVVLDDLVASARVDVLFHAAISRVEVEQRKIEHVCALARGGEISFCPKVVIDASGELATAQLAGADFLGLEQNERLQPGTMMFRFGPIDFKRFHAISPEQLSALAKAGVEQGYLARAALHVSHIPHSCDGWFNVTRLAFDATDPFGSSRAEIEGRKQAMKAAEYIRNTVPGCQSGQLIAFAQQVGIRESRRISGDYLLTVDDLRDCRDFPDTVALGAYPIDVHPAVGSDLQYEEFCADHFYRIPYRSFIPTVLDNVLVAGRGISATHEANAAIRVMPIAMAIGQAAGIAASLAGGKKGLVRQVDYKVLQDALLRAGAILG